MNVWILLSGAIVTEVIGTNLLKLSDGFSKLFPTVGALACYGVAFYLMSIIFKTLPIGIVYAIWSGVGIVLGAVVAYFAFGQKLDFAGMAGIGLIVAGVVVINVFSTTAH